nr:MAG TPA_asm: hypothetical protein [Caudoviricetes sp.]
MHCYDYSLNFYNVCQVFNLAHITIKRGDENVC